MKQKEKKFDKEKVIRAIKAVEEACLNCGETHDDNCPINRALEELKSI
jgi:hypothetical protein